MWGIFPVPPKILPFTFQELVQEGMRAWLQCVVSEGDLPLSVRWYKDGHLIPRDSKTGITIKDLDDSSSILTIWNVAPQHNGNYTCVATNEAASVSHSAALAINGRILVVFPHQQYLYLNLFRLFFF